MMLTLQTIEDTNKQRQIHVIKMYKRRLHQLQYDVLDSYHTNKTILMYRL